MRMIARTGLAIVALLTLASGALAEGRLAILIANERYDTLRRANDADQILRLEDRLEDRGFRVLTFRDLSEEKLAELMGDLPEMLDNTDRVLVAVSGHLAKTGRESWLLAVDADGTKPAAMGMDGVALGALTDLLGQKAGAAALLVGVPGRVQDTGPGVEPGFVAVDVAQGISVFSGPVKELTAWAADEFLDQGRGIADAAARGDDEIKAHGYLPAGQSFVPVEAGASDQSAADDLLFLLSEKLGTKEAYEQYLEKFPNGRHADEAQAALDELAPSPEELARREEAALQLSRDDRRSIQSDLTLLGYDTRGIDGIFGRGSRAAIAEWQKENGYGQTGYLTREQVAVIRSQGADKRASLRAEDDALWVRTRRADTEDAYREYLRRFPDGLYSDIAREEVARYEREREEQQAGLEDQAWQAARRLDTSDSYRTYLSQYPDGQYVAQAISRLVELESGLPDQRAIEKSRKEERDYFGNVLPRLLAERQLAVKGFDPGLIDGSFDEATRAAVRLFQQRNGLVVTGYIDTATRAELF